MQRSLMGATGVWAALIGLPLADSAAAADRTHIVLRVGDRAVRATLNGSAAAHDLVTMLPLTLHLRDLLGREKIAALPKPLSEESKGVPTYAAGDIGYWRPDGNFVVYYRQDGTRLPSPGIVPLGKIEGTFDAFDVPGDVDVTVQVTK